VLLDLDENSKQQQQKTASRETNSPNSVVNQRDQGLAPGILSLYFKIQRKLLITYQLNPVSVNIISVRYRNNCPIFDTICIIIDMYN